jgi:hypothetical protein
MSGGPTRLRDLLEEAAVDLAVPDDLALRVRQGAGARRRRRVLAAAAVAAAVVVGASWLAPGLLRTPHADVAQLPLERTVVPRVVPPLGADLPTLADRQVDHVTVAWTAVDPAPTATASVRLLGLDARDGQPVVLTQQVSTGSPVAVSPDGRAIAFVSQECSGSHQSLGVLLLAEPFTSWTLGQCDLPMTQRNPRMLAAPAFAWSADGTRLAAVVDRPQGRRIAVYQVGVDRVGGGRGGSVSGPAAGVAWAPGGVAVRRPDGSWDLVSLADGTVTSLPALVDGAPAQAVAWAPDGRTWAKARWGSATWGYRIAPWPADDQITTGGFRQALTTGDRWLVPSGPARFLALAGPFSAGGSDGEGLGVAEGTTLSRVLQAGSYTDHRGLPVSLMAFTGDQFVYAVGVAGDLMVDPTYVATVPDDGQFSWVSLGAWSALAVLALASLVGVVVRAARRRPNLSPVPQ